MWIIHRLQQLDQRVFLILGWYEIDRCCSSKQNNLQDGRDQTFLQWESPSRMSIFRWKWIWDQSRRVHLVNSAYSRISRSNTGLTIKPWANRIVDDSPCRWILLAWLPRQGLVHARPLWGLRSTWKSSMMVRSLNRTVSTFFPSMN